MIIKKLNDLKCQACSGSTPILTPVEINKNLKQLISWEVNKEGKMIFKKYIFKNFKKSIKFVNFVGQLAENEKHHPDISFGYSYCLIMLHTHAIKGLSMNDFILASKIDLISI